MTLTCDCLCYLISIGQKENQSDKAVINGVARRDESSPTVSKNENVNVNVNEAKTETTSVVVIGQGQEFETDFIESAPVGRTN